MNIIQRARVSLPWMRPKIRVLDVTTRPEALTAVLVPRAIADATVRHLRAGGERKCEEFAFWSGHVIEGRIGIVTRVFQPHTNQTRASVTVDDDAQLLAMTDIVHANDELVLCQLHTHPGDAFHSTTDDHGAVTDEIGFLSIVLPGFGADGLAPAEIYRRTVSGWEHCGKGGEDALLQVFDDLLRYEQGAWQGE